MQRLDNFEERVDALLRRIAKGAERRDELVEEVSQAVADTASLSACVEEVRAVSRRMLLSFVDTSASLARTIGVSASLAERSSRRVKQLDALLRRVREAQVVADSLQEMRRTVAGVTDTIDAGELERTVELICKYEAASANLGGRAPSALLQHDEDEEEGADADAGAENGSVGEPEQGGGGRGDANVWQAAGAEAEAADGAETVPHPPRSAAAQSTGSADAGGRRRQRHPCRRRRREAAGIIASAREAAREKLLEKLRTASRANDKLTIMHATRLLTRLGFREEGCGLYCAWLCEHTIAALKKMVERELRKMDDPTEAGMSHLGLVSTVLDVVVAAFENEEEFMRETFGDAGLLRLLTELHSKSTSQCVPVLKDFLKKRQEVLSSVTAAGDMHANSTGASRLPSGPPASSAAPLPVDPRRTDQILEEMSHLVSCCHLYWAFAQSKQREYTHGTAGDAERQPEPQGAATDSVDALWSSRDNPLMNTVQEILGVFVPLQKLYFDAAFEQALRLQMDALHVAAREATLPGRGRRAEAHGSPSSPKKAATFMSGLAALYTSTAAGGGGGGGAAAAAAAGDEAEEKMTDAATDHVAITLPDDVFFFLRIALHRAVNTKSTQIISAVFIACIELVQSKLVPVLQLNTALPPPAQLQQLRQRRPDLTLPSRLLRWTAAAHRTTTYAQRLAEELRQLARANFSVKDLLRFTEQAEDMDVLARELAEAVSRWVTQYAEVCYQAHLASHLERFSALSYNLTEEVFYHYELSDPWVQACVAAADAALCPFDAALDTHCFDMLLLALVRRVVRTMWQALLQKSFSGYGALQVDRDVRTLRAFFLGRAHELQLREPFLPLTGATSLLLLDSPRDAEQDVCEGLTAEEKRRVLGCRVEFKRAEIDRLRL
ncbi:uncharacterized protein Tco025E_00331 [Trypanosoma conorhini]|uniref:Conserved oligomeric Golgi complex subunit 4 n=1 Tax=Trypanosoma conorhini TaxID=83891 RepID=A0A3R7SB53_9TRYP|nr:uncharacterized protein Tco025E_00331 [Trypanosoma conorhini]RNF27401.1 hypothetical protein Tco025E_00331 [Trypanosoma conorhini]